MPASTDSFQEISYNGNYVPFVPKHTLTVGGQYIFRINPGYWLERIQLNAGYTGAGRVYWTEENTVSQSFYGTLNGRISFQKGHGQIDFWVRNALDKDYAAFYFRKHGQRIYAERTSHPGRNRTALQILANRVCRLLQAGKSEL